MYLVGGFNPFEKYYCSQNGRESSQIGVKIKKKCWKPPPRYSSSQGFIQAESSKKRPGHRFQCVHHVVDPCIVHGTALSGLHGFKPKVYLQVGKSPPSGWGHLKVALKKPIRKTWVQPQQVKKTPKIHAT